MSAIQLYSFEHVPAGTTKTGDANHSDIRNQGYDQLLVLINVESLDTADADETYEFKVQGKDPVSGTYYDILTTGDISSDGTGLQRLEIAAGISSSANAKGSNIVPETFRIALVTGGTTPSITYSVHVELSS